MNWAFISYESGGTFSMKDALVRMNSRLQFFMIECSIQFSKPDQRLHHSRLSLYHRSAWEWKRPHLSHFQTPSDRLEGDRRVPRHPHHPGILCRFPSSPPKHHNNDFPFHPSHSLWSSGIVSVASLESLRVISDWLQFRKLIKVRVCRTRVGRMFTGTNEGR